MDDENILSLESELSKIMEEVDFKYETMDYTVNPNDIEKYNQQREEIWHEKLGTVSLAMKDFNNLEEIQALLTTYKQTLINSYHKEVIRLAKLSKEYTKSFGERFNLYKNGAARLSDGAATNIVNGELCETKFYITVVEQYVGFLSDTMKTVDTMIYGIKNNIEIYKIKHGII